MEIISKLLDFVNFARISFKAMAMGICPSPYECCLRHHIMIEFDAILRWLVEAFVITTLDCYEVVVCKHGERAVVDVRRWRAFGKPVMRMCYAHDI